MPIIAEHDGEILATVAGVVLQPDLGTVEGFFVRTRGFPRSEALLLQVQDIRHFGHRVHVCSKNVLSPLEELVRLRPLLEEKRAILGQRILTESGGSLGVCRDVQFETKTFRLEWLFPKKFLRWRTAVPASAIVEVRTDAVIVRDPVIHAEARSGHTVLKALDGLAEGPVPPRLPEAS